MPDSAYLRKSTGGHIVRLLITGMAVQLLVIFYVFYQSYEGRVRLVDSQRAACHRGKMDRAANAEGWRNAEEARRKAGEVKVADTYARIAVGLERRSAIDCNKEFPNPGVFP